MKNLRDSEFFLVEWNIPTKGQLCLSATPYKIRVLKNVLRSVRVDRRKYFNLGFLFGSLMVANRPCQPVFLRLKFLLSPPISSFWPSMTTSSSKLSTGI